METKDARRRRKLMVLIEATEGGRDAVAVRSGLNPGYLKQIITRALLPPKRDGTRSPRALGDPAAESIEDAFQLGRGWFDSDAPLPAKQHLLQEPTPAYARHILPFRKVTAAQLNALDADQLTLVENMILQLSSVRDPPTKQDQPEKRSAAN